VLGGAWRVLGANGGVGLTGVLNLLGASWNTLNLAPNFLHLPMFCPLAKVCPLVGQSQLVHFVLVRVMAPRDRKWLQSLFVRRVGRDRTLCRLCAPGGS
jgi:hypothetical protein